MGFITVRSRSGREVFACEFSYPGCVTEGCTALRCPFGYCQRYYACPNCKGKACKERFTKEAHARCKLANEAYERGEKNLAAAKAAGEVVINAASNLRGGLGCFLWSSNTGRQFIITNTEKYTEMREASWGEERRAMTLSWLIELGGIVKETSCKNTYEYEASLLPVAA